MFSKRKMNLIRAHSCEGFTYIGLLLCIAILGLSLSAVGICMHYQVRSEKEKQLLFVGGQFRSAITSYYDNSPNAVKTYPLTLQDLLLDKRFPKIKRHLRRIYLDPITGKADWCYVRQQGHIVGVYSPSELTPFKKSFLNILDSKFSGAKSYKDWIFGNTQEGNNQQEQNFDKIKMN